MLCKDVDLCFRGQSPTLKELERNYNRLAPVAFLNPQITDLAAYSNCRNVLDESAIEHLAMMISNEFSYLKLTELMLFFYRFKLGKYENFYGAVSPMAITKSLNEFVKERNEYLKAVESREMLQKQLEERKTAITYAEYLEMKKSSLTNKNHKQ